MSILMSGITHVYSDGTRALDQVSLEINSGTFGLLGPNGAGKTTLMRILSAQLHPTDGSAHLFGVPLGDSDAIRQMLGYLPQTFGFYPQLTVLETLQYFAHLKELRSPERVRKLLEMVGLDHRAESRVKGLSGGMRQRLGIAVALLNDPKVLIVDEPTAGLDPEGRMEFRNLITTLPGERIVLLSSHIVEDIAQSAATVAVLAGGRLKFVGKVSELRQVAVGRVWSVHVAVEDLEQLSERHTVVSSIRDGDRLAVRCVGPGGSGFAAVDPTLEDGYVALLKAGEPG